MKLASTIGFLFGTHNNSCSTKGKGYLCSRRTQWTEFVHQAHPRLDTEAGG